MKFQHVHRLSKKRVQEIIRRDDIKNLCGVPTSVAFYSNDYKWAAAVCQKLAVHRDPAVRGNAIASSATLARRFRQLDRKSVQALIRAGHRDPHVWVRASAVDARQILKDSIPRRRHLKSPNAVRE